MAKKSRSLDDKETPSTPDYIDWQTFNQMVAKNGIPDPTRDSRGDTAFDENLEVRMGENFPNNVSDEEDELEMGDTDAGELDESDSDDRMMEKSDVVADSHSTLVNDMVDSEDRLSDGAAIRASRRPGTRPELQR